VVGQNVVVAGVGVAGYNNGGTNPAFFTVLSVPTTTTFTYVLASAGSLPAGTARRNPALLPTRQLQTTDSSLSNS